MVDYGLDFCRVKNPVLTAFNQVIDCDRCRDFVTENTVKFENISSVERCVNKM